MPSRNWIIQEKKTACRGAFGSLGWAPWLFRCGPLHQQINFISLLTAALRLRYSPIPLFLASFINSMEFVWWRLSSFFAERWAGPAHLTHSKRRATQTPFHYSFSPPREQQLINSLDCSLGPPPLRKRSKTINSSHSKEKNWIVFAVFCCGRRKLILLSANS